MRILRIRTIGHCIAVSVAALTISAAGMTSAPLASASSSASAGAGLTSSTDTPGQVCLTNSRSNCVSLLNTVFPPDAILGTNFVRRIIVGTDGDGHQEAEFAMEALGKCVADTGLSVNVNANWQNCGANGTVWVLVPHTNGAYLESRFALNRGELLVLTSDGALQGNQLFVQSPSSPGGVFWQTFTFFPS